MTEQEKQDYLGAIRGFLEKNDGRPFLLAAVSWLGDNKLDGMKLADGMETLDEVKGLIVGMMLAIVPPSAGTAKHRRSILAACCADALTTLEEQEDSDE